MFFFGGFFGNLGNGEVEFALIFFVRFPLGDPVIKIFKLRAEKLEGTARAYYAENGEKDMVSYIVILGEDVEDGGEDGESETGTVGW